MLRDALTIEKHRSEVASYMLKGYRSATKIRDFINKQINDPEMYISETQVRTDINALKNEMKLKRMPDVNELRQQFLEERLDLKRMYYEGYIQSQLCNERSVEVEAIVNEDGHEELRSEGLQIFGESELKQAKVTEKSRPAGDPAFLKGMSDQIDKIVTMYGLDAPSKVALTDGSDEDEMESPLASLKETLDAIKPSALPPADKKELTEGNETED